jgi:hypothetical protein
MSSQSGITWGTGQMECSHAAEAGIEIEQKEQ